MLAMSRSYQKIYSILFLLFFLSGCTALIYQIMWQRILFTILGIDLESITIIVSVFMFGLGVGSLLGGVISDYLVTKLFWLYIFIELSIAIFGFLSPHILHSLSSYIITLNNWVIAAVTFICLAIPTLLMGATFPILVRYVTIFEPNIGQSVGELYFANTLGGVLGAYSAGFILLYYFTISAAIYWAASLNLLIALIGLYALWRSP